MEKILLTVGITSYNRIKELERCLKSIKTKFPEKIEVLVSEDRSPMKKEIEELVLRYAEKVPFEVHFNSNKNNLGYDRNLKKILELAKGQYVFYMSDDDALYPSAIDEIINVLEQGEYAVVYSPCYMEDMKEMRRAYNKSYTISISPQYAAKHVYDSILFSGLIFRKELVNELNAEPFLNKNYFQVYMFLYCVSRYGGYYMSHCTVRAIADGENAYGHSDSSDKNALLADRTSALSNLEFHKGLISVIKKFDKDYQMNVFKEFQKEYNLHSIVGMANAESFGKEMLKKYYAKMKTLDLEINFVSKVYYMMLLIFGKRFTLSVLNIPKRILLRSRHEIQ